MSCSLGNKCRCVSERSLCRNWSGETHPSDGWNKTLDELERLEREAMSETKVRRFTMYRRAVPLETHDENQRNAPDEPAFEGVVFSDGTVALRWCTAVRSTSVWASLDDALKIHGHPEYQSELVWHDPQSASATQEAVAAEREIVGCADCKRPYGGEHGFPDLIIPNDAWERISPTGNCGGLLCPSCICKRLHDAKITCEGAFMSGPIETVSRPTMYALRRTENLERELNAIRSRAGATQAGEGQ